MSERTPSAPRSGWPATLIALAVVLTAAILGLGGLLDGHDPFEARRVARHPDGLWSVVDEDGAVPVVRDRGPGLTLQPGWSLSAEGAAAPARVSVTAARTAGPAALTWSWPLADGRALVARLRPAEPFVASFAMRAADGLETLLSEAPAPLPPPGAPTGTPADRFATLSAFTGFEAALVRRPGERQRERLELRLLGLTLAGADLPDGAALAGPPRLSAEEGPIRLVALEFADGPPPVPPQLTSRFDELPRPGALARLLARQLPPALVLAFAAGFLASLCRRPPPLTVAIQAACLWLAPAAFVLAVAAFVTLPGLTWLVAAGLLLGLAPALARLGTAGLFAGEARPPHLAAWVLGVVAAAAAVSVTAEQRLAGLAPLIEAEDRAVEGRLAEAPALPPRTMLDASHTLTLEGPYRDLDLTIRATLGEGAVLQVRQRAPDLEQARGVSLFLPADDVPGPPSATSAGLMFAWEQDGIFAPLGAPGLSVPPGRRTTLHLEVRGRDMQVWMDADEKPAAKVRILREPEGHIVLLAARGEVLVEDILFTPLPPTPGTSPAPSVWRTSCLPLLGAVLLCLVAVHLLERRGERALLSQMIALAPLPLIMTAWGDEGALDPEPLRAIQGLVGLGSAAALVLGPGGAVRRGLAGVAALLVTSAAVTTVVEPPLPLDGRAVNDLRYVQTHDFPLAADRLAVEHPLLRRWNGWLAAHRFRGGREATLRPVDGRGRVLVLGGSSTWGYHLPAATGREWPARLEQLLDPGGDGSVEVLNAAYPAATGPRLLNLLEHHLLAFQPDVVVLCLGYNDAFAQARPDEQAWFARRLEQGTGWSPADRADDIAAEARARDRFLRDLVAFDRDGVEPWSDDRGPDPAARFAAMLGEYADLSAEAGAELVLVAEPLSGERRVAWYEPLMRAMGEVAAARGLTRVEPQMTGGDGPLFMDIVHPTAAGHAVLAGAVAPAVAQALSR